MPVAKGKKPALVLTLVLLLQLLLPVNQMLYADTVTAEGKADGLLQEGAVSTGLSGFGSASSYLSQSGSLLQSAEDAIYNGMLNMEESIDLSAYKLNVFDLSSCVTRVINLHPNLFYVSGVFHYTYGSDFRNTLSVDALQPEYSYSAAEVKRMTAVYEQKIAAILSQADDGWTDLEKVLFAHDYIAQNFEYDTSYSIYDAYNLLTQKTGVCQAYSLLFIDLMNRMDVPVSIATSDAMNHVWNLVRISGKWYHVDVTWDDPTPDTLGLAYHDNLLLSDAAIQNTGHYYWETDYDCTDTTYENAVWTTSNTPLQYADGVWYSIDEAYGISQLYSYDLSMQTKTAVCSLDGSYSTGLDLYDGCLYFNTGDALLCFDPQTDELTTLDTPTADSTIQGSRVDGFAVRYQLENGEIYSYLLQDAAYGDVDGDGAVEADDALTVLRAVVQLAALTDTQTTVADVDADGSITAQDALLILRRVVELITAFPAEAS